MAGAHPEAVHNKVNKPELVQIILNTEADLGLEADVAIVRNVNNKLVESAVATERQCWENAQYSRRDTLELVGIPILLRAMSLSRRFVTCFRKLAGIYVIVTFRPVIV